ncbi:MAG: hypothetical protein IAE78_25980 [Myxococcus sp.]|nr:hypothetical protein [Myxococcus sp.]
MNPAEAASLSEDMHRQLARLFTRVTNFVPHLEWFPVARRSGTIDDAPPSGSAVPPSSGPASPPADGEEALAEQPELFPPGPLFAVTVRPSKLELAVQERKALHPVASDEHGRVIRDGVAFEWKASSALSLSATGSAATIEGLSASATESVEVLARQAARERVFIVPVRVVSELHPARRRRHPPARGGQRAAATLALAPRRGAMAGEHRPPRLPGLRA